MKSAVHYGLHFLFPAWIAFTFFRSNWKKAYLFFLLSMFVDLDHLLANPIFEPNRCSIQFHPLHSYYAMGVYAVLSFLKPPFRWLGIGLVMHMLTDMLDCLWTYHVCSPCLEGAPAREVIQFIHRMIFGS